MTITNAYVTFTISVERTVSKSLKAIVPLFSPLARTHLDIHTFKKRFRETCAKKSIRMLVGLKPKS